jgi:hypothetical protein
MFSLIQLFHIGIRFYTVIHSFLRTTHTPLPAHIRPAKLSSTHTEITNGLPKTAKTFSRFFFAPRRIPPPTRPSVLPNLQFGSGSISICNAQLHLTGYVEKPPPARRRLQPASQLTAKLPLCTLGYAGRKRTKHVLPALQAGEKQELCFHTRRRLEPAPSEGGRRRPEPAPSGERMVDAPDAHDVLRRPCARRDAMHCVSTQAANSGGRHPPPVIFARSEATWQSSLHVAAPDAGADPPLRPAEFAIRQREYKHL